VSNKAAQVLAVASGALPRVTDMFQSTLRSLRCACVQVLPTTSATATGLSACLALIASSRPASEALLDSLCALPPQQPGVEATWAFWDALRVVRGGLTILAELVEGLGGATTGPVPIASATRSMLRVLLTNHLVPPAVAAVVRQIGMDSPPAGPDDVEKLSLLPPSALANRQRRHILQYFASAADPDARVSAPRALALFDEHVGLPSLRLLDAIQTLGTGPLGRMLAAPGCLDALIALAAGGSGIAAAPLRTGEASLSIQALALLTEVLEKRWLPSLSAGPSSLVRLAELAVQVLWFLTQQGADGVPLAVDAFGSEDMASILRKPLDRSFASRRLANPTVRAVASRAVSFLYSFAKNVLGRLDSSLIPYSTSAVLNGREEGGVPVAVALDTSASATATCTAVHRGPEAEGAREAFALSPTVLETLATAADVVTVANINGLFQNPQKASYSGVFPLVRFCDLLLVLTSSQASTRGLEQCLDIWECIVARAVDTACVFAGIDNSAATTDGAAAANGASNLDVVATAMQAIAAANAASAGSPWTPDVAAHIHSLAHKALSVFLARSVAVSYSTMLSQFANDVLRQSLFKYNERGLDEMARVNAGNDEEEEEENEPEDRIGHARQAAEAGATVVSALFTPPQMQKDDDALAETESWAATNTILSNHALDGDSDTDEPKTTLLKGLSPGQQDRFLRTSFRLLGHIATLPFVWNGVVSHCAQVLMDCITTLKNELAGAPPVERRIVTEEAAFAAQSKPSQHAALDATRLLAFFADICPELSAPWMAVVTSGAPPLTAIGQTGNYLTAAVLRACMELFDLLLSIQWEGRGTVYRHCLHAALAAIAGLADTLEAHAQYYLISVEHPNTAGVPIVPLDGVNHIMKKSVQVAILLLSESPGSAPFVSSFLNAIVRRRTLRSILRCSAVVTAWSLVCSPPQASSLCAIIQKASPSYQALLLTTAVHSYLLQGPPFPRSETPGLLNSALLLNNIMENTESEGERKYFLRALLAEPVSVVHAAAAASAFNPDINNCCTWVNDSHREAFQRAVGLLTALSNSTRSAAAESGAKKLLLELMADTLNIACFRLFTTFVQVARALPAGSHRGALFECSADLLRMTAAFFDCFNTMLPKESMVFFTSAVMEALELAAGYLADDTARSGKVLIFTQYALRQIRVVFNSQKKVTKGNLDAHPLSAHDSRKKIMFVLGGPLTNLLQAVAGNVALELSPEIVCLARDILRHDWAYLTVAAGVGSNNRTLASPAADPDLRVLLTVLMIPLISPETTPPSLFRLTLLSWALINRDTSLLKSKWFLDNFAAQFVGLLLSAVRDRTKEGMIADLLALLWAQFNADRDDFVMRSFEPWARTTYNMGRYPVVDAIRANQFANVRDAKDFDDAVVDTMHALESWTP
jgi:hypothetical protein